MTKLKTTYDLGRCDHDNGDVRAYDPALARKGLAYAVTMAAKEYAREHCGDASEWCSVFPPETRQTVADLVMTDAEFEWSVGNHWKGQ